MTVTLAIALVVSIGLNIFLGYYSFQAARSLMNISQDISVFWASLIEYKDFLDSINDMHAYRNDGTIRGFVEATKNVLKEIREFKEVCELSNLLTEEEMEILDEMEEDYEQQKEDLKSSNRESVANEHIREWDQDRKERIQQQRPTVPSKTKGIQ